MESGGRNWTEPREEKRKVGDIMYILKDFHTGEQLGLSNRQGYMSSVDSSQTWLI